ncbi:hypothetical protein tinsulaeT_32620 [Thalassotalea insulae]|uniref:Thioredoxin domain-containing protein n=1 Tax=Thalassotalea insulae TaxID=2056778 RepID=A0ABQ6GZB8_9GAMM|nr:TlpA disulfide reductase family protein [Thalassotalea insulae]GLX79922.1 hypothetical protein tinsulaeT_32620 [Thalassotalea insulae]
MSLSSLITNKISAIASLILIVLSLNVTVFAQEGTNTGDIAPKFNVTTLAGEFVNSVLLKDKKPIYLKFWATWCSYCKEEMPHLQKIFDRYGHNIEVVAINIGMNDSIKRIGRFFEKYQYNLPVVFDEKGELVEKFMIRGTPQHILIDEQGKIVHRSALITDDLHNKIVQLSNK